MTVILRTLILGGLVGIAGWWTWFFHERTTHHETELAARDARIELLVSSVEEQGARLVEQERQIVELETALWLSKIDHRVARVVVLDQVPIEGGSGDPGDPERVRTSVRFIELDDAGEPLGEPVDVEIEGKLLYIDALVIKFSDQYVEGGDALRGTSVCIFRRLFGEEQKPSDGAVLDRTGTRPLPYRGDDLPDPFYDELWERFWDYANDPEAAAAQGVRAVHGEAPYMELRPGKTYRVELRASGGLTIRPE